MQSSHTQEQHISVKKPETNVNFLCNKGDF